MAVVEGVTLIDAVQYAPLGGKSIHYRIMDELFQRQATIKDKDEEYVIKEPLNESLLEDIKVSACFVAPFERGVSLKSDVDLKPSTAQQSMISSPPSDVKYPIDGQKVLNIPGALRESVCEVLFEMYGYEHTLPTLIIEAIIKCPVDVRKDMSANIVVIGGTAMTAGLKHRLLMELKTLANSCLYESKLHFNAFKIHELPCKENYVSWLGASIYGATDIISTRVTTIDQYFTNNMRLNDWSDWMSTSG